VPLQGVAGASPESSTRIMGIRDDILQLEDRSTNTDLPASERLTPQQQFTNFLISDASKIVDAQGRFIGHGIRFAIRPNGWGQTRCAERLWRILPSIQMDDPQTDHGLTLYQENAFGSQNCRGPSGDLKITRAENTTDLLTGDLATFTAPSSYSVINIDGRPTQSVDDLSMVPIEDSGAGFAGRGMYGNYVLLFPSQTWSIDQLEKVKDVLLRFDINDLTHAAPL